MPRKTNQQWWHEKADQLQSQAVPFIDIAPDTIYPKNGFWPAIKLAFMKHALGFYAPIMAKHRDDGDWKSLHFIDLCAGSGLTRLNAAHYPGKFITVTGSALIGAHEERFDHYHYVEPSKAAAKALKARLAARLPEGKFTVHNVPAEQAIPGIVEELQKNWPRSHFMTFVDPEGLTEVTLPSLMPLFERGRGDFLFNYQYMGVRRVPPDTATAFFGDDGWQACETEKDLQDFFLQQLRSYGRPASMRMDVIAGKGSGRYAYDMVYCASETKAGNPWLKNLDADIANRTAGLDGHVLEDFILGGQKTLF